MHQLQTKKAISAYLFKASEGLQVKLDNQDPEVWNDHCDEVLNKDLVVHDPSPSFNLHQMREKTRERDVALRGVPGGPYPLCQSNAV